MPIPCKPVPVSRGGFAFCRYATAALLWAAFALRMETLVVIGAALLAFNALVTVRWAPTIVLYHATIDRLFPSGTEALDEHAMRFAHALGAVLLGAVLALLVTNHERAGWALLFWVAVGKTLGALGFCAAQKLYGCLFRPSGGTVCCPFLKGRDAR